MDCLQCKFLDFYKQYGIIDCLLYFDSLSKSLREIEQANEGEKVPLLTYRVKPNDSQADYSYILKTFLSYHQKWWALKTRIEEFTGVAERSQALAELGNALFEIMPCSRIPLLFYGKIETLQLQFETFVENSYLNPAPAHRFSQATLEQAVRKLTSTEQTGYQLWGYGDKPLALSEETALEILSEEQGKRVRHNADGDSYVTCLENFEGEKLYFKIPSRSITLLQPLIETFAFELNHCLGGGLVSPSRLLIIEKPNQEKLLVQVSLGVGEIGLDKLLLIPAGVQYLIERMKGQEGQEALLKILPDFINEAYFENWWAKQDPKPGPSFEAQKAYFIEALKKRGQQGWPKDLCAFYQEALKTTGDEALAYHEVLGKRQSPWLKVLALMESSPKFLSEDSLDDLLCFVNLFEATHQVYPKISAEVILNHAPKLLDCISRKNYSQHFFLSLLTSPGDGKADNFRVDIQWDEQGLPIELHIISIDNDIAFMSGIANGKPSIKTVIYALSNLIKEPIESSVLTLLSRTTPDDILLVSSQ